MPYGSVATLLMGARGVGMILVGVWAGVNTLRPSAGCTRFLQSALQLTQGP